MTEIFKSKFTDFAFEKSLILGVDPGFSGALAVIDPKVNSVVSVIDMPVTKPPKSSIVITELCDFVVKYAFKCSLCVIEEVGAMTGRESRQSMFRFGLATGIVHGVVASHGIPIAAVKPQIWKSSMGLTSDKSLSVDRERRWIFKWDVKYSGLTWVLHSKLDI